MSDNIIKDASRNKFILIALILFTAIFVIEKINGRFWLNDFKVFYMAAEALLSNSKVYGVAFGLDTGFYKYSPATLLFFIPFTLFNFNTASIIDFCINAICSVLTIVLLVQIICKYLFIYRKISYLVLLSILLCIINHLVRELHLGNTNMILIFLLSLTLKYSLESKPVLSGILFAIVILTKPYFVICLLPFLLSKKYKTILTVAASLIFFMIIQTSIAGFSNSFLLYSEWFSAMKEHSNYLSSRHTIFSLMDNYFGISLPSSLGLILLCVYAIILFIYFYFVNSSKGLQANATTDQNKSFIVYFFMLMSIIPNLLITDTEHFLFSLPLITIILLQLTKEYDVLWIILFIFLIFFYGGNSSDLLGKKLAGKFEEYGFLGISNILINVVVFFLFSKDRNSWKTDLISTSRISNPA